MSQGLAVGASLGAATCAALAAALQSRSAGGAAGETADPVGGLARFARAQLGRRLWWFALLVQVTGFVLHALALNIGALTLVQPLMASAVVLAIPLNHYLRRTAVTTRELGWAVLIAAGLSAFLVSSSADRSTEVTGQGAGGSVAALLAVVLIAGCVAAARRGGRVWAAALLGIAAATAFTAEAALLQVSVTTAVAAPARLLTSTSTYGLVLAGLAGVALTQLAYRAGPMSAALPAIVTVNPLLSVGYGVLVRHDTFRHTPLAIAVEIVSLVLLTAGAFALTRHPEEGPRVST